MKHWQAVLLMGGEGAKTHGLSETGTITQKDFQH
jgi:hypothetical protein